MKARRAALACLLALAAAAQAGETVRIAVIHTNDVHGWLFSRAATWYKPDPRRLVGGFPALTNYVKHEKLPRLLLDAGDWFQGTPEANFSSGTASIECFNALGYDAVEIGNHDFDFGLGRLERLARALTMPVLGANIYQEKDGERPSYVTPYFVKDVAGVKVGVFGLLTRNMRDLAFEENYHGLRFRREADEARDMVRRLRAEGATVVIAVTHVGYLDVGMTPFEDDKFIAGEAPGIDLIVGGHTHTRLQAVRDPRNGTLVTQAGSFLMQVGRAELEVDKATGKVVASTDVLVDLWVDSLGEDAVMKRRVGIYQAAADRVMSVVVADARETLSHPRTGEEPLGDWMCDCERAWAGADIAFQNHGGIRADLPAGPVSLRRLYEVMPFDNRMATMTLTGAQVRATLEQGVAGKGGMLQVAGLTFRYAPDAERGKRLREVRVAGKPLDDAASYLIATSDFLANRGDGYGELGNGKGTHVSKTLVRDVLTDCARGQKVVRAPAPGRIGVQP